MNSITRVLAPAAAALFCACDGGTPPCSLEEPCPRGSYCVGGECKSDCDPQAQDCSVGVCTSDGRCARTEPDPDAGVCAAMVLDARFGTPTVVVLVDQSGSMTEPYSGDTRWSVLREALIDPDTGIISQLQGSYRFGLTLYTNSGGPTCPELTVVPPALDNRDAIAAVYEPAQPEADTPTGEAIDAVVQDLVAFSAAGPKHIIVASDGEPDTCASPNPQTGQPESVAAAERAFGAGITLFFLSVGSGAISEQHMQDMANAGVGYEVGGTRDAPYYEAGDALQLEAAFAEITGRLLTCALDVNGTIEPEAEATGVIYLDGNRLTLGDTDGWEVNDDDTFRLKGAACEHAQREGEHTVTAEFGCDEGEGLGLRATGGGVVDRGCDASPSGARVELLGLVGLVGLVGRVTLLRGRARRGQRRHR